MSKLTKKIFTYVVVFTTVIWSIGLVSVLPVAAVSLSAGDVIKSSGKAVYYYAADGKRYVFPTDLIFKTWYKDFTGVRTISDSELSAITIGGNVVARGGVKLVQFVTNDTPWKVSDPKVYAVTPGGKLRQLTSADVASGLYGANWESRITPVVETLYNNYTIGNQITSSTDVPDGSLIKYSGSAAIYYVDGGKKRAVDTMATMDANRFQDSAIITIPSTVTLSDGTALTGAESTITNTAGGASTGTSTGTGLTVALASDTPSSGLVVGGAARYPFTKVNLTASSDGDIVIDSLVMQRGGLGSDGAFSSLAIIDVATAEQIGLDKTLNSDHEANLNDDITIKAGTTKTLLLAGNMVARATMASYAGEAPALCLKSITLSGSVTLTGTLPICGNTQTTNATIIVGTATLGTGASNPAANSSVAIGTKTFNIMEFKISNTGSAEDEQVEQVTAQVYDGSVADGDIKNIQLVDSTTGSVLATVAQATSKKVIFNLSATPLEIKKGYSKDLMIRADIDGGAARTLDMVIKKYTDLLIKGKTYGYYVTATAGTGASGSEPIINGANHTVGSGTLAVAQGTLAAANIAENSQQVTLGKFDFTVKGESVEMTQVGWQTYIDQTTAGTGATTSDITNITIYDENGKTVAGPTNPTHDYGDGDEAYGSATTTDTITLTPGTHTLTVKGNLSADFSNNDVVKINLTPNPNITAKGVTTGNTITATPATVLISATMTVKTVALVVSMSSLPSAQTVVKGVNGFTLANIILDTQGSGEDVNVTQVAVSVKPLVMAANELSGFAIYDGTTKISTSNDPDNALSSTAATNSTSTFTFSSTLKLTKGTVKTLTVKANISRATSASDTVQVGVGSSGCVSASGSSTGSSITASVSPSHGPLMTLADNGSLTIYASSASPIAGLLPASTSGVTVGVINISGKQEDINLQKIYLTATAVNSGGLDQIDKLYLYDGSTQVIAVTPTTSDTGSATVLVDMTNTPVVITAGASKDLTIKVDTAAANRFLGSTKGMAGQGLSFSIAAVADVTAQGVSSGSTLGTTDKTVSCSMNQFTLYKSVPTVTVNSDLATADKVADGTLTTSSGKEVYKFRVAADSAGDIGLYQVSLLVTTSTATTSNYYLYDGGTKVAATTTASQYVTASSGQGGIAVFNLLFTNDGNAPSNTNVVPLTISAGTSKILTLKADLTCSAGGAGCTSANGSSVQFQFLGDSAFPSTYPNNATTLGVDAYDASFIWGDYNITNGNSSTTASTSEQWTNGYRVKSGSSVLAATSSAVSFTK
ncbi:MAG: hypothetical protein V1892_03215 [bacterium]